MTRLRTLVLTLVATLSTGAFATSYTVKAGDTLYSISRAANLEPAALMKLNNLSSSTIQLGQTLKLGGGAAAERPAPPTAPQAQNRSGSTAYVRTAASRFLGIRYLLGGTSARGIDCSAFTGAVMRQLGINLPRTALGQFGAGSPVSRGNLQAGDLVFFNTMGRGVSHVGLYLGDGQFANANSYQGRTVVESMMTSYWSTRYVGARRVMN